MDHLSFPQQTHHEQAGERLFKQTESRLHKKPAVRGLSGYLLDASVSRTANASGFFSSRCKSS